MELALSRMRGLLGRPAARGAVGRAAFRLAAPRRLRAQQPWRQAALQIHERLALIERLGGQRGRPVPFRRAARRARGRVAGAGAEPAGGARSADHPLAAGIDIPFARLAQEPLVMREPGSGIRMIVLRLFARHGIAPKIRMELGSDEAIREAVLAGLGVADPAALHARPRPRAHQAGLPRCRGIPAGELLALRLPGRQAAFRRPHGRSWTLRAPRRRACSGTA